MFALISVLFISGCVDQEPLNVSSAAECSTPVDCEGRLHIMCLGNWKCIEGKCVWQCSGEHLETPKNWTGEEETAG